MFKPELWQSHDEYQTLVTRIGRKLSRNNPKFFISSYEKERQRLFNLNLDPLIDFIPSFYSDRDRPARHQARPIFISEITLFIITLSLCYIKLHDLSNLN